jgi:predicted dehydrogenase
VVSPSSIGVIGTGWRAEFFLRLAVLLPEQFTVVGVTARRTEVAEQVRASWAVPTYSTPNELVQRQKPDFVVSSVPWPANPEVVTELVGAGTRVLCETPPAPDLPGLRALWAEVGDRDAVQVAEQYLAFPGHSARRELVRNGVIGEVSSVQVSSTHGYHAVSIMRGLLGAGFGPATVAATSFTGPLVDPLSRDGWSDDDTPHPAANILATIDFGDGRSGLYDFTDNQWHNQLRLRRILIRGSHGEIADDTVIRLAAPRIILRSSLVRSQLGYDLNLDGYDTEHLSFDGKIVYRNPFLGLRLMDEEIAIASMMTAMAAWVRDEGPPPYPLAQACQDHLIGLAIDEAVETGNRVRTAVEPWAH